MHVQGNASLVPYISYSSTLPSFYNELISLLKARSAVCEYLGLATATKSSRTRVTKSRFHYFQRSSIGSTFLIIIGSLVLLFLFMQESCSAVQTNINLLSTCLPCLEMFWQMSHISYLFKLNSNNFKVFSKCS